MLLKKRLSGYLRNPISNLEAIKKDEKNHPKAELQADVKDTNAGLY